MLECGFASKAEMWFFGVEHGGFPARSVMCNSGVCGNVDEHGDYLGQTGFNRANLNGFWKSDVPSNTW